MGRKKGCMTSAAKRRKRLEYRASVAKSEDAVPATEDTEMDVDVAEKGAKRVERKSTMFGKFSFGRYENYKSIVYVIITFSPSKRVFVLVKRQF